MSDMLKVIEPKSDQINAEDLIGRDLTIVIREVQVRAGTEQPVSIYFEGSDKAFRPCKSVSRILVAGWGPDTSKYMGRSLVLFRDENVKWAGMAIGGIRIRAMSDINGPLKLALAENKKSRAIVTVQPLVVEKPAPPKARQTAEEWAAEHITAVEAADSVEALAALQNGAEKAMGKLASGKPDLHTQVSTAYATKLDALTLNDDANGDAHDEDGVVVGDEA